MKNVKKLTAFLMAGTMALSAALPVRAYEADTTLPANITPVPIAAEDAQVRDWPNFNSVTGEVTSIEEHEAGMRIGIGRSTMENDNGDFIFSAAYFHVTPNTFFLGEAPVVGDNITGFFDNNMPMTLIYPPQYTATVVVNREQYESAVYVDRFTTIETFDGTEMVSQDGLRRLNADNSSTTIVSQGGQDATDWDLNNRLLVVVYNAASRSMPPLIFAPEKIIVMYEVAVHPIGDVSDMALDYTDLGRTPPIGELVGADNDGNYLSVTPIWEQAMPYIIINGVGLAGVSAHSADSEFLTHVPLRAVAEAIDPTVSLAWNRGEVTLTGAWGNISFTAGTNNVTVNGRTVSLNQATLVEEGRVLVPLSFFREVAGMNNAYALHGQVHINNFERME